MNAAMRPVARSRRNEKKRAGSDAVHMRALVTATDTRVREPAARKHFKIRVPFAGTPARERGRRVGITRDERVANVVADLVRGGADAGPSHATNAGSVAMHRRNGVLQNAGRQPAPPGVRGADDGAIGGREAAPAGNRRRGSPARHPWRA